MLIALYQDSESDFVDPFGITFGKLIDRYGLPNNERWLDRLAKEWQEEGLAEVSDHLGPASDFELEITARGMRDVENRYGGKDGIGTILNLVHSSGFSNEEEKPSAPLQVADAVSATTADEVALRYHSPMGLDSARWTGIEQRLARDPARIKDIRTKIREIDGLLSDAGLSNREMAKARAISEALIKLAESPEPEWKAIVDLLQSPALGAALNVVGLIQLIVGFILGRS
jgi:hypothetical protein